MRVVEALRRAYPNLRGVLNTIGPSVVNAIRAGVADAKGELILIFAADEVGPVIAIDDMLGLADRGCEFVSCTRYAHGGRRLDRRWPLVAGGEQALSCSCRHRPQ